MIKYIDIDESKGRNTFNLGQKKEKYIICLLTPLSFLSPWLHLVIVSMEEAWILLTIFPIKCPFISYHGGNLTKDNPLISQVQYSEATQWRKSWYLIGSKKINSNSGYNIVSMISVQGLTLKASWGLLIGPLGVRLVGKREKGWRWGKEATVAKTGSHCPSVKKV